MIENLCLLKIFLVSGLVADFRNQAFFNTPMANKYASEPKRSDRHPPRLASVLGLFMLILLPLYLFGYLAEDVASKEIFLFDAPTLLYLHQNASPAWDTAMGVFSTIGSARVLVPFNTIIFLLLLFKKELRRASFWGMTVCGAALMNLMAKHAFARARPDLWISILPETTFSFPSGHAMQSMAVACGLIALLWNTRWRMPMTIWAALFVFAVGLSRVYLGVHYPSDILAGWAASLAWVIGLHAAFFYRHPHDFDARRVLDKQSEG